MVVVKLTVPNILSASRIALLPLLYYLLYSGSYTLFLVTYILVGSTDYFDGLLARRLNQVSPFGKELDSLADLFFYLSSAYFLYYLQPGAVIANWSLLMVFFAVLGFSFILSGILFGRPMMMHTILLRWNAVMVFFLVVSSFWIDTTLFVRLVIFCYMTAFAEEILIFIYFGKVDPDTKSIFHLMQDKKKAV